jgi:hypothetical protein
VCASSGSLHDRRMTLIEPPRRRPLRLERQAPGWVTRRCAAPAAFLLIGMWGATWMAQPAHVPGDISRVAAALDRHPSHAGDNGPPLTSAERQIAVGSRIGVGGEITAASAALAILFGILAGPVPRPWLFRLHRLCRVIALTLSLALGIGMLAELSTNATVAAAQWGPVLLLILPLLLISGGFAAARLARRRDAARAVQAKRVARAARRTP